MIVSSVIDLKASELTEREWRQLFTKLSFVDAEGRDVRAYQLRKGGHVRIPRGAWALLPDRVRYLDRRVSPSRRSLTFEAVLDRPGQSEALTAALREEQGIVVAQPGFGKTMVALGIIEQVETPWLVLVHTEDIFNQWIDYATKFFMSIDVGSIQGRYWSMGDITVAMVQTVRDQLPRFRQHYAEKFGGVIVDEVHHAPAETWEMILNRLPAKYRIGFTATESRADGMQPLMQHLVGPIIFKQKFSSPVPVRVVPLKSGLKFPYRGRYDWGRLQAAIVTDGPRNLLIARTAVRQLQKGHSVLVLSRRIEHLERLALDIATMGENATILTGKTPRPKRKRLLDDFRAGKVKCLLSTQLMDEAVDVPILSRVILTYPGKHDGRIIQQVGRALRPHADKTDAVIFDVVDDQVSVLRRQWLERKATYKKLKIKIEKKDIQEKPRDRQRESRETALRIRSRLKRRR
jgi:superfamily II DNA or RNA helicase